MSEKTIQPSPDDVIWFRQPVLRLWLISAMLATLPVMTNFFLNRYQVSAQDLVLPILLSLLTASIVTVVFAKLHSREPFIGFVAVVLATILLSNDYEARYQAVLPMLQAINPIPGLYPHRIFSLAFIVIVFGLAYWAARGLFRLLSKRGTSLATTKNALTIIIVTAFVFQFLPLARVLILEWPQFFYKAPALAVNKTTPTHKPDIYYIVLDRYASQDILQKQFNFDNAKFLQYLSNNQFTVNNLAVSNYPYTAMSIASTLSANYHTDLIQKFAKAAVQTLYPYHRVIRNSPVIAQLKQWGYQYYLLGSWYEATNQSPLADTSYQYDGNLTLFNKTITLDALSKNELTKSVYWHFVESGLRIGKLTVLGYEQEPGDQMTMNQFKTLKKLAAQPAGGRFIFAHILVPHDPYYFNADGSLALNADSNNNGALIKQKYLAQVQYANDQMQQVIDQINTSTNGQAVIVLQSDEGPYPMQLNDELFKSTDVNSEIAGGNMLDWSEQNLKMKFGVLAAYHIPAASVDELKQAGDSVNVFRLVFNKYFGQNLSYLPRCSYAFPDGREEPFVYTNVTQRLTGQENSLCPADSNFAKE